MHTPWVHTCSPMNTYTHTHNPKCQYRINEETLNETVSAASLKSSLWALPLSLKARSYSTSHLRLSHRSLKNWDHSAALFLGPYLPVAGRPLGKWCHTMIQLPSPWSCPETTERNVFSGPVFPLPKIWLRPFPFLCSFFSCHSLVIALNPRQYSCPNL